MRKLTTQDRKMFESTAVLSNVVHACVLAMGRISNSVPTEIDGVAYTAENLSSIVTKSIISKLGTNNVK